MKITGRLWHPLLQLAVSMSIFSDNNDLFFIYKQLGIFPGTNTPPITASKDTETEGLAYAKVQRPKTPYPNTGITGFQG